MLIVGSVDVNHDPGETACLDDTDSSGPPAAMRILVSKYNLPTAKCMTLRHTTSMYPTYPEIQIHREHFKSKIFSDCISG